MSSSKQPTKANSLLKTLLSRSKKSTHADVSALPLDFDAKTYISLNPDVAQSGQNPYLHYIAQGQYEGRTYKNEPSQSNFPQHPPLPEDFDAEEYRRLNPDLKSYEGDLREHFLQYGIPELRKYREVDPYISHKELPSDFDSDAYLALNPDVAFAAITPYEHYLNYGLTEGRKYKFPDLVARYGCDAAPDKPTILLVGHEASRTGAPILTWNICHQLSGTHNVVAVLLGDGPLLENFQSDAHVTYALPHEARNNLAIARYVVDELRKTHPIRHAVVNSIVAEIFCEPLTVAEIPNILLIHEFAAYTLPQDKFLHARTWASRTIFSTELTKGDAQAYFPQIFDDAIVIPQGQCLIPQTASTTEQAASQNVLDPRPLLSAKDTPKKLIIGLGTVSTRKGVDLFIEVATRMEELAGQEMFEFMWVGNGFHPTQDPEYSAFLKDQVSRCGLQSRLHIVGETDNLKTLYEKASMLVLSSRLDPLPNVAIDAICLGLPLVCFDKASGIADILTAHGLQTACVANYIDTSDMAKKAVRLLESNITSSIREALIKIGADTFSMPRYCSNLVKNLEEATLHWRAMHSNVIELLEDKHFDAPYYATPVQQQQMTTELSLCWEYVLNTSLNKTFRKPKPGFNPLAYRERLGLPLNVDPLIHRAKQSSQHESDLITPTTVEPLAREAQRSKVALHLHVFYPELLSDIVQRLQENQCALDLFLTVDSEAKKTETNGILLSFGMEHAHVECQPNVGRDIFPFIKLCGSLVDQYDVIGHLHTKKSPHLIDGSDLVMRWRELLLGNLVGSVHEPRMLDRIIGHMDKHPEIQIVFPDDPHVMGWGKNEAMARELVSEEEFSELPKQFDFPIGTMFWARSAYLRSFLQMNLPERYAPTEPLPIDGTVLHAWERLLGAKAATGQPPRYALTFVPGLTR